MPSRSLELHVISPIFSWEYPGNQGIGCNEVSANDSANFLEFLKDLRGSKQFSKTFLVTASAGLFPFTGPDGSPVCIYILSLHFFD